MTFCLLAWLLIFTAAPAGAAPEAGIDPPVRLLLPDLRTLPPFDLAIENGANGRRELRLSNMLWNSGSGPVELLGELNRATQRTQVYQHLYDADHRQYKFLVGEFVFHPTHDHWHTEGFTLYQLWSLAPNGDLAQVVSSSDKLSYCVMDTDVIERQLLHFSALRRYIDCNRRLQGLSVGWGDKYKSTLDGQALDLEGVPDGFYALQSIANPNATIIEANYANNAGLVYLELRGSSVREIATAELSEARCLDNGWC